MGLKSSILLNKRKKLSKEVRRKMSLSHIGKKQSIETIKKRVEKNTGQKRTKETRRKMSLAKIGKTFSKTHIENLSKAHKGYKMPDEQKRKIGLAQKGTKHFFKIKDIEGKRARQLAYLKKNIRMGETKIEKILYDELNLRKINFKKQEVINNRFMVDAFIPSRNLIIEADGKFWHSLDRVIKKDKAENAYLIKCGYQLLRLPEEEIINGNFRNKI